MASGKPIVSTNLPAVNFAKRVIEIAADIEDFHCKVNRLLKETSFDAAQRQANSSAWPGPIPGEPGIKQ